MKRLLPCLRLLAAGTALLLSSAAAGAADLVLPAVGPADHVPRQPGGLIVYSATLPSLESDSFDWENNRYRHSDYALYRTDGTLYRRVRNNFGPDDEHAKVIPLPPGTYVVRALAERDGWVRVPVVVKTGRLTQVVLARSADAPAQEIPDSRAVRTPSGRVVGWKTLTASMKGGGA